MNLPKLDLTNLADFIDRVKNFVVALIFIGAGFYMSTHITEFSSQWVNAAMLAGGVYIGSRIEKGKQSPTVVP